MSDGHNDDGGVPWETLEDLEDHIMSVDGIDHGEVRCTAETAKAILCEFPDGAKRWVPISHVKPNSEVHKKGDVGELVVSSWLSKKWEDGDDNNEVEAVVFAGCTVMEHSDKAIRVMVPNKGTHWFPRTQTTKANECQYDGDHGNLSISKWIATQKGLV